MTTILSLAFSDIEPKENQNMISIRKIAITALAVLLCALFLGACKTVIKPGEGGLYDEKHDVRYYHASTVYEATARGKEYGTLQVTDTLSYKLYVIPGVDPTEMLATDENNIIHASTLAMPTLSEMGATTLNVCMDGTATAHVIHTMRDRDAIAALAEAYENAPDIQNPGYTPIRTFRVRFESPDYAGFYYTLTYVEFSENIVIDGTDYGRYFLQSLFDGVFAPVPDVIHVALGYDKA